VAAVARGRVVERSFSMTMALRILTATLLVTPVFAADPPRFALWKAGELKPKGKHLTYVLVKFPG
jgi:hypothetical protein